MPPNCYSYLLVDWANYCAVNEAYDEAISVLDRILGIKLSKQALETGVDINASEADRFYEQKPSPRPEDEGKIVVVQVDGKVSRVTTIPHLNRLRIIKIPQLESC